MKFNIEKVTMFLLYSCFYFSLVVLFLLCKYNKITLQDLGILLSIALYSGFELLERKK